ncbi:Uncharacterised protein [Klebsiella pneumoniae]|nr:Uncharacterised protein [Klebsiella pneumoniae]
MAGAKDEVADRLAIRRFPGKQVLRRFGLRAKIVADKIGDPLGAGKIQIVFRAKIIGDSGDILPGLGGDIAVVACWPYSPNWAIAAAIS